MRSILGMVFILVVFLTGGFLLSEVSGQSLLTDNAEKSEYFFITLSGMANKEKFFNVRGMLTIAAPGPISLNPYLVIVIGYPQENSRNSFFWNSEFSSMTALSSEIVCDIKNTWAKFNGNHFFYLSPTLLENKGPFLTQHEKERRKLAEKRALPTKIFARAGRLVVSRTGQQVSGSVWIKGYDFIQHAHILYHAQFYGRQALRVESSKQKRK